MAAALGLVLEVQTDPQIVRAFGKKPIAALWEDDKDLAHFARWKTGEPDTFNALVLGKPGSEDGDYFKAEWIDPFTYSEEELPAREFLEVYAASDHAVSLKAHRDYTVLGSVGLDEEKTIWVLPDLVWERMDTKRAVEEMIAMMIRNNPFYWWMESENISKSFGPFLFTEMEARERLRADRRSQGVRRQAHPGASIQGRMSMKKVRFPRFAPWFQDARAQMLRFDKGANDDFVDFMAHIGLGLQKQFAPPGEEVAERQDN
jgi:phage terminase large subunit-like protein